MVGLLGVLATSCVDAPAVALLARHLLGYADGAVAVAELHLVVPEPPTEEELAGPDLARTQETQGGIRDEPVVSDGGDDQEIGTTDPRPEEEEGEPPPPEDPAGPPVLASVARETWVFAEPSRKSRRVGYLRAGAVVDRAEEPAGTVGCRGGWYAIEPRGFVCRGKTTSFDRFHPVVEASRRRPRLDGLPYDYVMSRNPTPPLYARVPTDSDQARSEPDLRFHQRKLGKLTKDPAFVPIPEPGPMPPALLYGRSLPGLADDKPRDADAGYLAQARLRSGFALLAHFEEGGRPFGMTTDLAVVPLDRTRWIKQSTFQGLRLDDSVTLPVAFVMKKRATRYEPAETGRMKAAAELSYREAVPLTGRSSQGGAYLEAKDGSYVRAEDVRRIGPMSRVPSWAQGTRKWLDVSILQQSLVAYEGSRPVYVTLVSTGADGIGDPKETHSTIQGVFLVHTKHVTATMDGEDVGDEFDLRDVPFVQYFTEGYAIHGAYWHDDFGVPRSHGCVNVAPIDAAWLFGFTTPDVPTGWHAALTLKHGTLVYTHP